MTLAMYGIRNCDTVKKARAWLDANGVAYEFHDYKAKGADPVRLTAWAAVVGWESLLNRAGTTFRKLSHEDRTNIDEAKAIALMVEHPSLIKRPVVEHESEVLVGFKSDRFAAAFG